MPRSSVTALTLAAALSACGTTPVYRTAEVRLPSPREVALLRTMMAEAERISRLSDDEVEAELSRPIGEDAPKPDCAPDPRFVMPVHKPCEAGRTGPTVRVRHAT